MILGNCHVPVWLFGGQRVADSSGLRLADQAHGPGPPGRPKGSGFKDALRNSKTKFQKPMESLAWQSEAPIFGAPVIS